MVVKYFRIQPRVNRKTFEAFQNIANQKGTDMSKLARQLLEQYIESESNQNQKTPA